MEQFNLELFGNRKLIDHDYFYLFRWIWGKDFDFMKFDFHKDLKRALQELSPYLDACDPDLSKFKALGHKLLVVAGSEDAIIPYPGLLKYYQQVIQLQGGLDVTKDFFRFFLMPGLFHIIGGCGVQDVGVAGFQATPKDFQHDVICAMEQWVEKKKAPECLLGTHFKGKLGQEYDYARPSYAYPFVEEFRGGDPKDHANYIPVENKEIYEREK